MKRPDDLDLDFVPRPDTDELRDAAQNLVRLSNELFRVARWIERGKEDASTYWDRVEELQEELSHAARSLSHDGKEDN